MLTSDSTTTDTKTAGRPVRLRMAEQAGRSALDGGWWPYSHDLDAELGDLVAQMPSTSGRIVRAVFSPPDWDTTPRRITLPSGYLKVGSFPRDDTHLMLLRMSDHSLLRILVVPPEFSAQQGEEALLAAATGGNATPGADLLHELLDKPDVDARDVWDGEAPQA